MPPTLQMSGLMMSAARLLEDLAELAALRVELLAGDDRHADLAPRTRPARPGCGPRPAPRTRTDRTAPCIRATRTACIGASRRCTSISSSIVGPDRLAHGAPPLDRLPLLPRVMMWVRQGSGEGIELQRGEPARRRSPWRLRRRRPRASSPRAPAVGVDADALAAAARRAGCTPAAQPPCRRCPTAPARSRSPRSPEVHGAALGREVVVGHSREVLDVNGSRPTR